MVVPATSAEPEEFAVPPRFLPRDALDWVLSITAGLMLTCVLFGIPAAVAFAITGSRGVALITCAVAYGVFLLFSVRRLSLSPSGIRFHRVFGSPRFLPWSAISSIAAAPRAEVVIRGWLWPLFPPRESTPSLSALQHFRIAWDHRVCYYPPADPEMFRQYVSAHLHPPLIG